MAPPKKDDKRKFKVSAAKPEKSKLQRYMLPPEKAKDLLTPEQVVGKLLEVQKQVKIHHSALSIEHWFETSMSPLNYAINRGIPGGRIVEFSGPTGSGKSTLASDIIAQAQLLGGRGDIFDLENAATVGQLRDMGKVNLDPSQFKLWRPDTAEQCFAAMDATIGIVGQMDLPSVIVLDSVPSVVSFAEMTADYDEEPQLAQEAKFLRRFCRKNMVRLGRFPKVLVILINHLNTPFKVNMFDRPEPTTPGGKAPKYYSTVRLRFDSANEGGRDYLVREGHENVLIRERPTIHIWKNRVGSSNRKVKVCLSFLGDRSTNSVKGFDAARTAIEFLKEEKVFIHPSRYDEVEDRKITDTLRWVLDGFDEPAKFEKDWVAAYNAGGHVKDLIEDAVTAAAQNKWTPEEADFIPETKPKEALDLADIAVPSPEPEAKKKKAKA